MEWARSRWVLALIGLAAGALAGTAVYGGSHLTGLPLFILCGATAGVVGALVVRSFSHSVRLAEIAINVPQFSELRFTVTKDSRQIAWKLFVETSTRIAVQPLDAGAGLVREAMNSLYTLFSITREILKETPPSYDASAGPTVEHLAISMLNRELRPFLAHWHRELGDWEKANPGKGEADWPRDAECRAELAALQQRLLAYVLGYGRLARLPNARQIVDGIIENV